MNTEREKKSAVNNKDILYSIVYTL